MKDIEIINKYIDPREFRNYVQGVLLKHNYVAVNIDDERLSDDESKNDNDIRATKGDIEYTVQTYLNKKVTLREIEETVLDMKKENVDHAIIITNDEVSVNAKAEAELRNIRIIDKENIEDYINVK